MAIVTLKNLTKVYDRSHPPAAEAVSLDIAHGEFMVLLGPSGCGKTTTLRMIAGLESISSGELLIDGRLVNDVPAKDRDIAMVFQSYALYPHMTVKDNLSFGLKRRAINASEIERRVQNAAGILGLSDLLLRKPHALSGGQRQRVALGRAIVRDPKVFLFDEPLSNLDAALRVSTRGEIAALHRRLGATMIYVTHDQVEAMTMGTRICIMNKGRVVQVGAPLDVYRNPANTFVAAFLGSPPMNLLSAVVEGGSNGRRLKLGDTIIEIPEDRVMPLAPGSAVTLGIRPETVAASSGAAAVTAELIAETVQVERLGAETLVVSKIAGSDAKLIARISGDVSVAVGETRPFYADLTTSHVFDQTGNALRATPHLR